MHSLFHCPKTETGPSKEIQEPLPGNAPLISCFAVLCAFEVVVERYPVYQRVDKRLAIRLRESEVEVEEPAQVSFGIEPGSV